MCCMQYEDNQYLDALAKMPKINSKVKTPDGEGIAVYNNVLKGIVTVKFVCDDGSFRNQDYALSEIKIEKYNERNQNE